MSVYSSLSRCSFSLISPVLYCSSRTDLASSGCKHKESTKDHSPNNLICFRHLEGEKKSMQGASVCKVGCGKSSTHPHPWGQIYIAMHGKLHINPPLNNILLLHFKNPRVCFKVSVALPLFLQPFLTLLVSQDRSCLNCRVLSSERTEHYLSKMPRVAGAH